MNGSWFVVQAPVINAVCPKDGPSERPEPDVGRKRWIERDQSMRLLPTSVQAAASGADEATFVSSSEPATAAAMKTVPPRRYRPEMADGSPMRRRSQSDCSSNVWKRTSRNSAATEYMTRYRS